MITQTLNPALIAALNSLVSESEEALEQEQKTTLKAKTKDSWIVDQSWIDSFKTDNRFICYREHEGKLTGLLVFQINDSTNRENLNLKGNFAIFIKALVARDARNSGVLKELAAESIGFIRSQVENPELIACVSAKEILRDGEERIHVMNLERYSKMMLKKDPSTSIQLRYRDAKGQYGRDVHPARDFLEEGKISESKVESLLKTHQPKAERENKSVMGLYVRSHLVSKL